MERKNDVGFRIKKMMKIDVDIDNCKNFQCKAIDKIFDLESELEKHKRLNIILINYLKKHEGLQGVWYEEQKIR